MPRKSAQRHLCVICDKQITDEWRANARICSVECAKERKRRWDADRVEYRAEYEAGRAVKRQAKHEPGQCEMCGKAIPGFKPGQRSKTCSDECRRARASAREKARYEQVKNTPEWKATRAAYLEQRNAAKKAQGPQRP